MAMISVAHWRRSPSMRECAVARPTPDSRIAKARRVELAGRVHRPGVAAQEPRHGLLDALAGHGAMAGEVVAEGIERHRHQGKLAVFAVRQVELAAQLVFELAAQLHVAALRRRQLRRGQGGLLLELAQGLLQLLITLALPRLLDPDTAHQVARTGARGGQRHAGDAELAQLAAQLHMVHQRLG